MSEKQGVGELFDFVKAYARQETLDPLKGAGRWLALGVAGSLLLMIGTLELTLALLRALQTETDTKLTGNLSWLPYVITLVAAALVAGLLWRGTRKRTL